MYKHAAILVAQGVQDEEFIYPYYRFLEEEFDLDVVFVSTEKYKQPIGKYGIPFKPTYDLTYATEEQVINYADKYDILVIPGGWQCPEILRMDHNSLALVREMNKRGKIIAAICHGPQVLISADVVRGKMVTGFKGIWDDLKNAGAIGYNKEFIAFTTKEESDKYYNLCASVITYENLITAEHYRDNPAFMKAIFTAYNNTLVPKLYQC